MKYLIVTNSVESCEYASLLVNEIQRFDIRSQVFLNTKEGVIKVLNEEHSFALVYKSLKTKLLKGQDFDLLIVIGDSFDKKLTRECSNLGIKTSFFQLTLNYSKGKLVNELAIQVFDRVFVDLPIYRQHDKNVQIGHYLNDLIRKHDFATDKSNQLRIGLLTNDKKNASNLFKLISEISNEIKDAEWIVASSEIQAIGKLELVDNIQPSNGKLDLLKNVNVVIVDSEIHSIVAALLNCPQISISGRHRIFGFAKEKRPLLKEVLKNDIVKHFSPHQYDLIRSELNLILNDHEYCATMLTDYQNLKDEIGTQPVAREAVRIIVEWLEEN